MIMKDGGGQGQRKDDHAPSVRASRGTELNREGEREKEGETQRERETQGEGGRGITGIHAEEDANSSETG